MVEMDLDMLLNQLAEAPADRDLGGVETAVSRRIAQQETTTTTGGLTIQMAVVGMALLLGIIIARVGDLAVMPSSPSSETVVLSDDSALAPSVKLEGGT